MATDFNYVARLDTTQIMSGLADIRSQVGMALSSPTGFASPAMSLAGGGFSGMSDVSGAIGGQFQQMFAGLGGQGQFGGTFTNPAIAYSPHYGMVQAQTSLEEEWKVHRGGLTAAQTMKPPGVSAAEYAMGVESNFINRQIDAGHAAKMAAQSSFYAGAGGLAAGELGDIAGKAIGAFAGAKIAGSLIGGTTAKLAGGAIGGLIGGWEGFTMAQEYVGGKIEKHFADVEQKYGTINEMGEIAGAGRGLNRRARVDLGIAAMDAAKDLKMDDNQMADILALGRQAQMLPNTLDPSKTKEAFRDFARSIEEGAQILHTSMAGAAQVIKTAAQAGMSSQEGVMRAAGAGGADIWLAQQAQANAFAAMGAATGRSMGFTGAQGAGVFGGAMGGIGGAGLSHEEMTIMGGRMGAAAFVGSTQMQMAAGPLGNVQLMAAMGGQSTAGMGMMGLPGAAMSGLMAGGGDMLSNMIGFQVHQNEYRRGIGARGIQTMAREQIRMGGEMISQFAPNISTNDAERMYAMSALGMNPDQAKTLVGGGGGRGGGGGGYGGGGGLSAAQRQTNMIVAAQGSLLHDAVGDRKDDVHDLGGFGMGMTFTGGAAGFALTVGTPIGAAVGAAGGFIASNWHALGSVFDSDGPSVFASSDEKSRFYARADAAKYDAEVAAGKSRIGYLDIDEGASNRFQTGDVSQARLDFNLVGSNRAMATSYASLIQAGLKPVSAGPGTTRFTDSGVDVYLSTTEIQQVGRGKPYRGKLPTKLLDKFEDQATAAAYAIGFGDPAKRATFNQTMSELNAAANVLDSGAAGYLPTGFGFGGLEARAAGVMRARIDTLIGSIPDTGPGAAAKAVMITERGTLGGPGQQTWDVLKKAGFTGADWTERSSLLAGRTGAAGVAALAVKTAQDNVSFLNATDPGTQDPFHPIDLHAGLTKPTTEQLAAYHRYDDLTQAPVDPQHWQEVGRQMGGTASVPGWEVASAIGTAMTPVQLAAYNMQSTVYHTGLMSSPTWLAGAKANDQRLMQQGKMDVMVNNRAALQGYHPDDIDLNKRILRPGVAMDIDLLGTERLIMEGLGVSRAVSAIDAEMAKKLKETTSVSEELGLQKKIETLLPPPKKRHPGAGMLSHAIGFGEQESAMASIQRSMASTEKALRSSASVMAALDKKLNPVPTPPPGTLAGK